MIVLDQADGSLLVVAQPDHAQTCGQMMRAWRKPVMFDESAWRREIEAAEHHDDGWHRAELEPTLDAHGRPQDFKTISTLQHVAIWRESIELNAQRDAYVGLLVALHARWLYTALPSNHVEEAAIAQAFVDELNLRIDALIHTGKWDPAALSAAQRLLSFVDALSLALLGAIDLMKTEPLHCGDKSSALAVRLDTGKIQPWPFMNPSVTLTTQARQLPVQQFANTAAFIQARSAGEPRLLSWTLRSD